MIINGELENGLGGGVCQVSTTTFNAAYEAGLSITERTNHALYISHYPQGRDATVNYPDTRPQVRERHRALAVAAHLRQLVVADRRALRDAAEPARRERGVAARRDRAPTVKRIPDPNMLVGQTALEESGQPSRSTSVRRRVYDSSGKLMYDHTWYSSYRSEPRVIRYGTKPMPPPKPTSGAEGAEEEEARPPPPPPPRRPRRRAARLELSASAIASASQAGTRVGRWSPTETQACVVQPSATWPPSRSTE